MIELLALGAVAVATLFAVYDWRRGLFAVLVIGFAQDPLRKLIPGQAVVYTAMVVAVFGGVVAGAIRRGELARLGEVFRWFRGLRAPTAVFVAIVIAQSGATLLKTGSWVLAGLGLLSYLSPVLAIVVGQRAFTSVESTIRWMQAYAFAVLAVAVSVIAQFAGLGSPLFRSIGLDSVYGIGGRIQMMCGVMRSSEIAAWHMGVAASLLIAFAVGARKRRAQALIFGSVLLLLAGIVLTGRRKMLVEVVLYLICLTVFLLGLRGGASRLFRYLPTAGILALSGISLLVATGRLERMMPYLDRGLSVVGESGSRLQGMTLDAFEYVLQANGFLGSGAGTGSQGSQYYSGGWARVGAAAEGGLAKVLAELGVPGLVAAVWLSWALGLALRRILHLGKSVRPDAARLFYGMVAVFPANAAVFVTAHQVFGDPFVVLMLGLLLGATLALPRHAYLERQRAAAAARAGAPR